MASHFESVHDGHENRLSLRPRIAAICKNVLADQNSKMDSPLPAIVIRRHFFVIKECDQFVSMTPQSIPQPSDVFLFPDMVDEIDRPVSDFHLPTYHDIRNYVIFCFFQPHYVHDQSVQSSIKLRPVVPGVVAMPGSVQIR